jgi:hypothetical protein
VKNARSTAAALTLTSVAYAYRPTRK